MHLQNGYGVTDLSPRPHPLLLPPDTPSLPTNFPIPHPPAPPPPPPPNLDPSQQFPPHQFQLFWQHDQQQQQQQTPPVVVDPNFPLNNRAWMDAGNASPHNLIGFVSGGGGGFTSYRPPPSVVVTPQPLRWINQEDPLWKCVHKSDTQTAAMDAQFGDQFGGVASSKPEIDHHYSQSPGSVSEIYESAQWPSHDNGFDGGAVKEKKTKKKHKCCTEEDENRLERELKLMARFIEGQLMAHQDRLHQRFTAAIERMERERREREESWRAADAEAARAQAAARAREQALASSREAVIVSYLERISGQKIAADRCERRWPQAEVEALIGARSGLEPRFREPGPKALLWEEVSSAMEGMGFHRSAKRCKEKWENINKYFRKSKDDLNDDDGGDGIRRAGKRSKLCSYFDQLDQHYNNSRAHAMPVDHRIDDPTDDATNVGDSTPPDSSSYNDDDNKSFGDQLDEDNKG